MLLNVGIVTYLQALSAYLISPRKVRVFGVIGGVVGGRDLAGGRGDVVGSEGRGKEGREKEGRKRVEMSGVGASVQSKGMLWVHGKGRVEGSIVR